MGTFLISDTHFSHRGVCEFTRDDAGTPLRPWDCPEEMDEAMIRLWNGVVSPKDKVYHLGDVAINRRGLQVLDRLNGRKILVKGNHDIFKLTDYVPRFEDIRAYVKLDKFLLCHIPVHPDNLARWCGGNIHGHLHANRMKLPTGEIDPRYFNVSVEQIKYTPVPFDVVKNASDEEGGWESYYASLG